MNTSDVNQREKAFGQYLLDSARLSDTLLRQAEEVTADSQDSLVRSLAKLGFMPEVRLADSLAEFDSLPRYTRERYLGVLHCDAYLGRAAPHAC